MLTTADFKRGLHVLIDGDPYEILDYSVQTPSARGSATLVRTKVRNVRTDQVLDKTFKSGERFEEPDLEKRQVQFLYADGDALHFMDLASYEQFSLPRGSVGDAARWLIDGLALHSNVFNGRVIGVALPPHVELEVVEVDPGMRGDTASGKVLKEARVATGARVKVPLYLEAGERILVDTRTGEFLKRVRA
jgi:elongation factor P